VFDLGCGCGRVALALGSHNVTYAGADVDRDCIEWCRTHIEARNGRFRFQHINARNASYNPAGKAEARLPYPDGSFDLMLAMSVFTHLLPEDLGRTLQEAARVLVPGGALYCSAFLLGEEHAVQFPVARGHYALHREDYPENAVAYEETYLLGSAERAGFRLRGPIRRGVQELMVFEK
jgi:SAM-dependent methyltransferase